MAEPGSERASVTLGVSLKLYLSVAATAVWAQAVANLAQRHPAIIDGTVRLFVLPSLPAVPAVVGIMAGTGVRVGAQDVDSVDRGAFTGAVSGADLREIGCELAEVGHAERRSIFADTDAIVAGKLAAAARNGLTPVLCIGETERVSAEVAAQTCAVQLASALGQIADSESLTLIVAYEPVWAIGQATPAPSDHITAVTSSLKEWLEKDRRIAESSVIYGGSAQPGMLTELGDRVDGLFLGRFAHEPAELARIIDEAAALVQAE